ncbi:MULTISPECIES: alpha/beta fold hydrolase [Anaerolinea]|uniref:Hydrolase n=1 Tax=Anaerolinea thermophila (strain DSM 14523 / JCM 11388 / NBRC 100420 / UNI-1) TaxID=926569 RepID=E8N1V6_ANATU|nr:MULTISPECIES: alpha/beta hydrolase [Anaerolinea]BAJ62711.1 putative hydrolase [Anaerolinea thermophila UNI-1]
MSSITTDQGILHYEVYGRGRPVILLHGWLGSWGLWQETMTFLGQYYRTYALDFWGFGESGTKRNTYNVQDFISLVAQFMDQMGILSAPLIGHSMGGTVSLSVAIQYPHLAQKVVVIGSPIAGSSLALPLKFAGYRPIAWLLFTFFPLFRAAMRIASPTICKDPRFPDMMDRDLSQTTLESFLISIATLRRTDLRPRLHQIRVPVMGMYGDRDNIVHPRQWEPLKKGVPHARIERFPKAGHFIMLDEPKECMSKIKDFLDTPAEPLPPVEN